MTPYQRFHDIAAALPDLVAIDCGDRTVTYAELRLLTERVAAALVELDLPSGSRIGLVAHRHLPTYPGYLAVLRTGHTVVPIGPDNPLTFQTNIAAMAEFRAVLMDDVRQPDLAAALTALGVTVINPDRVMRVGRGACDMAPQSAQTVAYVLFTSGSTGRPKGVPIRNRSVSVYLDHVVPRYELSPGARLSHTFALTFDPSVFDVLGALTSGATLVLPRNRELLTPANYVNSRGLTHWYSVPSLISHARRIGNLTDGIMPNLRWSKFTGEPLTLDAARMWQAAAPASAIENVYGPTELTIACTEYRLPDQGRQWPVTTNGTVPIGTVYDALEWLLADPNGVVRDDEGELCVRGPQRFDGYVNPSDNSGHFYRLTGDRLGALADGEAVADGDWYRTGDRVRSVDGDLVHLGRIDRQVKVNGYRVELGDVENALRRHPAVRHAAALALPGRDGVLRLVGVLCGNAIEPTDVQEFLRATVPLYFVPDRVVWVPEMPMNANGKVDYRALERMVTVDAAATAGSGGLRARPVPLESHRAQTSRHPAEQTTPEVTQPC
jgi:amino acid adenylation domain-containing protein